MILFSGMQNRQKKYHTLAGPGFGRAIVKREQKFEADVNTSER